MDNQDLFNEVYDGNNYAMLVLESDGQSMKLKLKIKKVPGLGESGTIWAKRKGSKWVIDVGLGDEEYSDADLPNPIKKLIASGGGGPNGNAVQMPAKTLVISGYLVRPYDQYRRLFTSNKYFNLRINDKPIPESLYYEVGKLYLDLLGVPLYL
jgi:hypothetical protein